jgi:hypothetical protein
MTSLPLDTPLPYSFDFRQMTGPIFFNLLEIYCTLTHDIIENRLKLFRSTDYITKTVVNRDIFFEQQNRSIQLFKTGLISAFALPLEIFIMIIQWNSLLTWSNTNYAVDFVLSSSLSVIISAVFFHDSCACFFHNGVCLAQAYILYRESNGTAIVIERLWPVPNILIGCYPFQGSLWSSLSCLYNESCLSELIKYLQPTIKMNISLLEKHSLTSIFNSNTIIRDITYQLMVEKWEENIIYELYYEKCNPKQCTYTYVQRFLVSYIISAILGIIGGLSLVLRLIIPNLVKLGRKILMKIRKEKDGDDQEEDKTSMYSGFVLYLVCFSDNKLCAN